MKRRRRKVLLISARENRAPAASELRGRVDPSKVCHRTKRDAARAFIAANDHVIQEWGGLDLESSGGEFDAINERYGLKGKRRARTLADAIWTALPVKKPYCLDRVDLDALNETAPALELGAFRLPDAAAIASLDVDQVEPPPARRGRGRGEAGPGYPLTGYECETPADAKGRRYRVPCASAPAEAEPTGRVLYRPRVGGRRPRVYLDEHDPAVETEDEARELRAEAREAGAGAPTDFDFATNPSSLTVGPKRSTMANMAKRDRHGRFVKRAKSRARAARRNPQRRRRARRNPMPETALLINPSRGRRRRRARRNPARKRRRSYRRNPGFSAMRTSSHRRRRYRKNPSILGAGFTLSHAAGAGLYGALKNGVRRLYWMNAKTGEESVGIAKFNKHSNFIKAGLVLAGWALRRFASHAKWKDVGEGMMLGGISDGLETLTENFGLTPAEKDEKEARKKLEAGLSGAGVLVGGSLSSVLVERERQLRAADDDELDELDPDDVFDGDDDELAADEDELY